MMQGAEAMPTEGSILLLQKHTAAGEVVDLLNEVRTNMEIPYGTSPPRATPQGHHAKVTATGREYSFGGKGGNGGLDVKKGLHVRVDRAKADREQEHQTKEEKDMREQYDT